MQYIIDLAMQQLTSLALNYCVSSSFCFTFSIRFVLRSMHFNSSKFYNVFLSNSSINEILIETQL